MAFASALPSAVHIAPAASQAGPGPSPMEMSSFETGVTSTFQTLFARDGSFGYTPRGRRAGNDDRLVSALPCCVLD